MNGYAGRIDRRQTASDQQYCDYGIHNQQEKKVEDIDELNHKVAFRLIQNGSRSNALHDNQRGQQEKYRDSEYPLIEEMHPFTRRQKSYSKRQIAVKTPGRMDEA